MKTKAFPARVKAAGPADGLEDGQFTAIVSVFGNVDSYGDKVIAGAFADSLKAWEASGDPIPVIWSHQWSDLNAHIGVVVEAKELLPGDPMLPEELAQNGGLWVRGQLDIADPDAWAAKKVYKLLKGRRVTQFSFAYDIQEAAWVEADKEHWYELRKLDVFEVGPCLIGANQDTELIDVKALERDIREKAGRTLSAANEAELTAALADIDSGVQRVKGVLAQVASPSDTSKATATEPATQPDPAEVGIRSGEPTRAPARGSDVQDLALAIELAAAS